ncbi:MAG: DNA-binding protein [Neisseriales bacterium]|nr:MAG: DNA-binding protein [Neisseriales bacterium]
MGAISAKHGSLNARGVILLNIVIIFIVALVSKTVVHALRLFPGDDLKASLVEYCKQRQIAAATIVSCVGSLSKLHLRLASATKFLQCSALFEIVSLVGTLSPDGVHLYLSAADDSGAVWGGHLMEGNIVHTTAEIVIMELIDYQFQRVFDAATGYKELLICAN